MIKTQHDQKSRKSVRQLFEPDRQIEEESSAKGENGYKNKQQKTSLHTHTHEKENKRENLKQQDLDISF